MKYTLALVLAGLCGFVFSAPVLPSVTLFTKATDGFQCFRVPALLSTPKFLLAFVEGRNNVPNPDTCEFDETCLNKTIILKRSPDFGSTWSAMQEVVTVACGAVGVECGYENAVYDSITGKIFLTYVGNPGSFILSSSDFGETWSAPTNLSAMLPVEAKNSAPGHGIQIDGTLCSDPSCCPAGRLIIPYECYTDQNYACLIYSDDHGATWHLGGSAQATSRENEVVQIVSPNSSCALLYLNERDYNKTNEGARYAAWSDDAGMTFTQFELTKVIDPVTPRWTGAVAGLLRLTYAADGKSRILLSHPNNPTVRENLTIHISYDEGATWSSGKILDGGPSCYSDMTKLPNGNAAILYERGNETAYDYVTFVQFTAAWADEQ